MPEQYFTPHKHGEKIGPSGGMQIWPPCVCPTSSKSASQRRAHASWSGLWARAIRSGFGPPDVPDLGDPASRRSRDQLPRRIGRVERPGLPGPMVLISGPTTRFAARPETGRPPRPNQGPSLPANRTGAPRTSSGCSRPPRSTKPFRNRRRTSSQSIRTSWFPSTKNTP